MTAATVPRPPVTGSPSGTADWRPAVVAFLIAVLVAVPTAIAWTIGFTTRCAALIGAAAAEAYAAGRGPRE